ATVRPAAVPFAALEPRIEAAPQTTRCGRPRPRWPPSSIVVQDRAEAAVLREQRIAAEAEKVEVERLVGLLLGVALDLDGDGLAGLAWLEGQRAGLRDVIAVAGGGGAVHGLEGHRHRLVVGGRKRDREREQGRLVLLPFLLAHVVDA